MAYTTINKHTDYFNTKVYTGTGSTNAQTGVGFQPDYVWIKSRSQAVNHYGFDSVRGATKGLSQNITNAESTRDSTWFNSFDSDGFTIGSEANINNNSSTYASWNWLANNTSGSSNTDGSITSTVSANTTSGFSIVSYTGTGANATVGHGLGVAPSFVIIKDRDNAISWVVSGDNIGWNKNMYLNDTSAIQTANHFQDTAPTSSLMYLSTDAAVNGSSRNYIMYCFAEKKGFSKFGSYTGNGNADGTFVYTGFKPAFVMVKQTNTTRYWSTFDNKRDGFNPTNRPLFPNASDQESDSINYYHDILSNGFKWRTNTTVMNESGGTYVYMAFAENPIVGSNNIPATAR